MILIQGYITSKNVESEKKSGFLSNSGRVTTNIYIYDPSTGIGKFLFPSKENFQIVALSFEMSVENGKVKFNSNYSASIKNNNSIASRDPKFKMLILTRDVKTKRETFYFAGKDGSDLEKVKTISSSDDWHVDVKNSVVRVVRQVGSEIKIESFKW